MVELVPDGDKGDATENGGSQGSTPVTPTPPSDTTTAPLPARNYSSPSKDLWLDSDQMRSPIAIVDLVNANLTKINQRLAGSTLDSVLCTAAPLMMYSGIFGDRAIESAWSAFHQAWVRETGVTSSAVAELRKLLPDSAVKYEEADLDGGRKVGGVDVGTPASGVLPSYQQPSYQQPNTTPLEPDPPNSSGSGVAEPNGTMQRL